MRRVMMCAASCRGDCAGYRSFGRRAGGGPNGRRAAEQDVSGHPPGRRRTSKDRTVQGVRQSLLCGPVLRVGLAGDDAAGPHSVRFRAGTLRGSRHRQHPESRHQSQGHQIHHSEPWPSRPCRRRSTAAGSHRRPRRGGRRGLDDDRSPGWQDQQKGPQAKSHAEARHGGQGRRHADPGQPDAEIPSAAWPYARRADDRGHHRLRRDQVVQSRRASRRGWWSRARWCRARREKCRQARGHARRSGEPADPQLGRARRLSGRRRARAGGVAQEPQGRRSASVRGPRHVESTGQGRRRRARRKRWPRKKRKQPRQGRPRVQTN